MTTYVTGFAIGDDGYFPVVKKRDTAPYHAGKWNAPGGKIENGESPEEAMARELFEETGIRTRPSDWSVGVILSTPHGYVHFLTCRTGEYITEPIQKTDELVGRLQVNDAKLEDHKLVAHNLQWILPLCLDAEISKPVVVSIG